MLISEIKGGTLMADMQVYECVNCGNTVEVGAEESKLRFDDLDEPCDDGRSG
jgi:hypothetical protein